MGRDGGIPVGRGEERGKVVHVNRLPFVGTSRSHGHAYVSIMFRMCRTYVTVRKCESTIIICCITFE